MYDGKFNLYSSDGSVTAGDVQLEYNLTPDGKSKEKWFNLYSTDGAFVTGFGAAGEIPLNDLYAGQSGDPHYSRYAGSLEYISRRQSVKPEDYVGTWSYGRCYITVEEKENVYTISVKWSKSAAESTVWSYLGHYDPQLAIVICNGIGKCMNSIWTEDGQVTNEPVYEGGTAIFVMREGTLKWIDETQHTDYDLFFMNISE